MHSIRFEELFYNYIYLLRKKNLPMQPNTELYVRRYVKKDYNIMLTN